MPFQPIKLGRTTGFSPVGIAPVKPAAPVNTSPSRPLDPGEAWDSRFGERFWSNLNPFSSPQLSTGESFTNPIKTGVGGATEIPRVLAKGAISASYGGMAGAGNREEINWPWLGNINPTSDPMKTVGLAGQFGVTALGLGAPSNSVLRAGLSGGIYGAGNAMEKGEKDGGEILKKAGTSALLSAGFQYGANKVFGNQAKIERQAKRMNLPKKDMQRLEADSSSKSVYDDFLRKAKEKLDDPDNTSSAMEAQATKVNEGVKKLQQMVKEKGKGIGEIKAGEMLGDTGRSVDLSDDAQRFFDDLHRKGVTLDNKGNLDFTGSGLEGKSLSGDRYLLEFIWNKVKDNKQMDTSTAIALRDSLKSQLYAGGQQAKITASEGLARQFEGGLTNKLHQNVPGLQEVDDVFSDLIKATQGVGKATNAKNPILGADATGVNTYNLLRRSLGSGNKQNLAILQKLEGYGSKYQIPELQNILRDRRIAQIVDDAVSLDSVVNLTGFGGRTVQALKDVGLGQPKSAMKNMGMGLIESAQKGQVGQATSLFKNIGSVANKSNILGAGYQNLVRPLATAMIPPAASTMVGPTPGAQPDQPMVPTANAAQPQQPMMPTGEVAQDSSVQPMSGGSPDQPWESPQPSFGQQFGQNLVNAPGQMVGSMGDILGKMGQGAEKMATPVYNFPGQFVEGAGMNVYQTGRNMLDGLHMTATMNQEPTYAGRVGRGFGGLGKAVGEAIYSPVGALIAGASSTDATRPIGQALGFGPQFLSKQVDDLYGEGGAFMDAAKKSGVPGAVQAAEFMASGGKEIARQAAFNAYGHLFNKATGAAGRYLKDKTTATASDMPAVPGQADLADTNRAIAYENELVALENKYGDNAPPEVARHMIELENQLVDKSNRMRTLDVPYKKPLTKKVGADLSDVKPEYIPAKLKDVARLSSSQTDFTERTLRLASQDPGIDAFLEKQALKLMKTNPEADYSLAIMKQWQQLKPDPQPIDLPYKKPLTKPTNADLSDMRPKVDADPLSQEALKYKSADEFVKATNPTNKQILPNERPTIYKGDIEGITPNIKSYKKAGDLEFFNDNGNGIYVKLNGEDAGYLTKLSDNEVDLSVAKEFQGKGIGKKLVGEFLDKYPDMLYKTGGFTPAGEATYKSQLTDIWNKANKPKVKRKL